MKRREFITLLGGAAGAKTEMKPGPPAGNVGSGVSFLQHSLLFWNQPSSERNVVILLSRNDNSGGAASSAIIRLQA